MMSSSHTDTEARILEAAKKVFIQKGLEGARMQEIADEARINKSLLHYYYRTKEKLFSAVFQFAISRFVPRIEEIFGSDITLFEKIELIIDHYISLLMKNQFVPIFVLHEINRHPDRLVNLMSSAGVRPNILIEQIEKEIQKGTIKQITPQNLIINIISLCVFPFAARPLIQRLFFANDKKDYVEFLKNRKREVSNFIINAIKV